MNFIIAPCFTTVTCPQRGKKVRVCKEMMQAWCQSVTDCGLHGIVVYDDLPPELCAGWQQIEFRQVLPTPDGMTINDWRFPVYRSLLQHSEYIESAFFTDLFDAVVQHDPFPWLASIGTLAFGTEARLDQGEWMTDMFDRAFGMTWRNRLSGGLPRCTAGLFGGPRALLIPFLDIVCGIIGSVRASVKGLNCNMPAFQMAIHAGLCGRKIHFGPPLHHPEWRWGQRDPEAFFHHQWLPTGQESPLFQ